MKTLQENPLSLRLAKPLGQKSLSSALATALKVAEVLFSVAFAFVVVAAIFLLPVSVLVATHTISTKALGPPHLGDTILATWTVAIPYIVYSVVAARGALLIVRRLQSVFSSFVANEPFARDNAAHLRAIWVTLVVVEIARMTALILIHGLTAVFAASANPTFPQGFEQFWDLLDVQRWFLIFVVLVLAEVFRKGTQLHEETELTV
jgi:Protein of unknown function (DUF2975)